MEEKTSEENENDDWQDKGKGSVGYRKEERRWNRKETCYEEIGSTRLPRERERRVRSLKEESSIAIKEYKRRGKER